MKVTARAAAWVLIPAMVFSVAACGPGGRSDDNSPVFLERAYPDLTFNSPVLMVLAPGENPRWFVLEREGRVLSFVDDESIHSAREVLDLTDVVNASGEGGLLGMAFHPSFSGSGQVFLYYTETGTAPAVPLKSRISRFSVDPDGTVDRASELVILSVDQPASNHNGGDLKFGPDGYLYIGLGDGGGSGDTYGNGQDTTTLPGSILRIDVDATVPYGVPADNIFAFSATDRPEIYAWGFRNPWRFSFDYSTGDLWVGDVGQSSREEVDRVIPGSNYGWNLMEGSLCYPSDAACDGTGLTPPVFEYGRGEGSSITGGYVYRGSMVPEISGHYIFADWGSGRVWGLDTGQAVLKANLLAATTLRPVSFAQDRGRELYLLDYSGGGIYRLSGRQGPTNP